MVEKVFPYVPGNIVETRIGTTRVDKVCVSRVTNQAGVHVMKVVSQGYCPGNPSTFALPHGADPLGNNWRKVIKDPATNTHKQVCAHAFRFAIK